MSRNAIYLLEGPDGAGKTTVANALMELYGALVLKCGPPGDVPPFDEYMGIIDRAVAGRLIRPVVIDRLHVGEMVYGPLFRSAAGGSRIDAHDVRNIEFELDNRSVVKVALMPSIRVLAARQLARDGGMVDPKSGAGMQHIGQVRALYKVVLSFLDGWIIIDDDLTPEQTLRRVVGA